MLTLAKVKNNERRNYDANLKYTGTGIHKKKYQDLHLSSFKAPHRKPSELGNSPPDSTGQNLLPNLSPRSLENQFLNETDLWVKEDDISLSSLEPEILDVKEKMERPDVFSYGSFYLPSSVKKSTIVSMSHSDTNE